MTYLEFINQWNDSSPAVTAHTSGSTGTPKEIRLSKGDMRCSASATNTFFGIDSNSTLGIALSADYIAGKMMAVRASEAGCRLLELPVSNRLTLHEPVDLLAIVPSQVDSLLSDVDLSLVKAVIIGGAPLSADRRRLIAASGLRAYTTYGMTETCSHVAMARIGNAATPVYHAMPGITFDTDSRGCLVIIAPHMSFGRLTTNDVVELISTTEFTWLGRADNVINSGGIKIPAEQLEERLRPFLPYQFMVRGVPDDKWGQSVLLMVEADPSVRPLVEAAIAAADPGVLRPRHIEFTDSLPRTPNGKLKR